ncbi:hypothetical protein ACWD5V_09305 [Streptomyces sp. NPDC002523]
MPHSIPRLFVLRRDRDITGVSGAGDVADGVQWADGTVVLRWRERPSTAVWDSLELMLSVHGHDGATRVVWADDSRAQSAADRAYKLAERWQAAHGAAMFLVRTAGAELRDVLEEDQADGRGLAAVECSAQYNGGFEFGVRQCIRAAQHRGDHIDENGFHWSDTVAVYPVDSQLPPPEGLEYTPCACGHIEPEHSAALFRYCLKCGCNRYRPEPPNQGPLRGIEVRDPCPYCEDRRLVPRILMADHIRGHHPEITVASHANGSRAATEGTLAVEECGDTDDCCPGGPFTCRLDAARSRLREEYATVLTDAGVRIELGTAFGDRVVGAVLDVHHRAVVQLRQRLTLAEATLSDYTEAESAEAAAGSYARRAEQAEAAIARVRAVVADMRKWTLPGSQLASYVRKTEEALSDTDSPEACPYCTGGPQFPRSALGAHIEQTHARVLAALARGVSLDELLHNPESHCRLPHEMEG